MPTANEPVTVYADAPVERAVQNWSQQDLDDFRKGWDTLDEEHKKFSRAQPVLYANTPEGLLNIRTAEIVEKPVPVPVPKPDPKELAQRQADRAKKTRF